MIVSTYSKLAAILLTSCCYWSVVSSEEDYSHNCCEQDNCASYRGYQSTTVYGVPCMAWYWLPKSNEWHPDKWPNSGLEWDYCRNPGGKWKNAWCFVRYHGANGQPDWENCGLPNCTATDAETCCDGNCASYRGKLSTTTLGARCLPWSDLQANHQYHPYSGEHPDAGLELNYCRNPSGHTTVWCYIKIGRTSEENEWENCALPYCTAKDYENCCDARDCISYRAKLMKTRTDKICLKWTDLDEDHEFHPQNAPFYGLQYNYCRNPSENKEGAWCYVDNFDTYDFCSLPVCPIEPQDWCKVYDHYTGQLSNKWDHYYCPSHPLLVPRLRVFHGCIEIEHELRGEMTRGRCFVQTDPGQDRWCYSGRDGKTTLCNPNLSPLEAGKYCWERARRCTDFHRTGEDPFLGSIGTYL